MALIECNECGTQVSDKASKCPKCGNPMKASKAERAKTFFKSKLFIGIICSLIGLAGILVAFLVVHIRPTYWIDGDVWLSGFMTDYSNAYVSEGYSMFQHWLFVIIGLIFSCIAMKIFFPNLKKVYFIAFIAFAITFTGVNIINKKNSEENRLKDLQAEQKAIESIPDFEIKKLAYEKEQAGKELLTKELKGCYSSNVRLLDMPDSLITGYCNELNKLSIKTWNRPLNGLDLKVYQTTYENEYGNRTEDRFYVFFKDDKPIKFAKENIIREWSSLEILFLMKHNFE